MKTDGDLQQHRDELPDDLNAHGYVGPYLFPNNARRRYLAGSIAAVGAGLVAWFLLAANNDPLVNQGTLFSGIALIVAAAYVTLMSTSMRIREIDALKIAAAEVGFGAGPASAQMGWRGFLSRPTWRILLFSPEPTPLQQGFVMVDAIDGRVVSVIVQDVAVTSTPDTV
jgi:hypothetical protein